MRLNSSKNLDVNHEKTTLQMKLGLPFALAVLVGLVWIFVTDLLPGMPTKRLLLAPMIGQLEPCMKEGNLPPEHASDRAFISCQSDGGSAAPVIETTLSKLGPQYSVNGRYELGYTLNVPLLKLMVQHGDKWAVNEAAIARMVRTISQTDRRLVLYLFSTHFSSSAKIEPVLASDPANLAQTPRGPLELDKHFGLNVYPWSIARTDNSLSKTRIEVIEAMTKALCAEPQAVRDRLAAITLLGEVHHLFPSFESGMGFGGRYEVSDYSPTSVLDFQAFLKNKFQTITALNAALDGSAYTQFEKVMPPAKDIRVEPLQHFWEHIDSFASGSFPVQGWLAPDPQLTGWVLIFLNETQVARVHANLGRQDVLDNVPSVGSADVGWRHDQNFQTLKPGIYDVSAMAEARKGLPILLAKREIAIMDRNQSTPIRLNFLELPPHENSISIRGNFDTPLAQSNYFYNPLAKLWGEFRGHQVVRYQQFIERPLIDSCLAPVPRYIHQLFPYPNPSWDAGKYAVDESLRPAGDLRLGVSLYGEAAYGDSFLGWLQQQQMQIYGITEFHPLRAMEAQELNRVMGRHKDKGAQFLSFFLEGRGEGSLPYEVSGPTIPFIGEANTQKGSSTLYKSLQQMLTQP